MTRLLTILFLTCALPSTHGYEQAFPKTAVGTIEIKNLPPSTLIGATTKAHYFERSGSLFRSLFRYIKANGIAMTTPVEAEMSPGKMFFHIGKDASTLQLVGTEEVHLIERPEQTVLSIGVAGRYTAANFDQAVVELRAWLAQQSRYKALESPRAIYWNGPFTLGFLKHAEVHIPVAATSD